MNIQLSHLLTLKYNSTKIREPSLAYMLPKMSQLIKVYYKGKLWKIRIYRKKQQNYQKTTKTAASENDVFGASACNTHAIIRSPPAADNNRNHRSTPATTAHDRQWTLTRKKQKKSTQARAGHALSRRHHHGRGWTLPDRKKPTTTTEERMMREN